MHIGLSLYRFLYLNGLLLKYWLFKPHGPALRTLLEKLGPLFVKFGQLLSMRADLLPRETIQALRTLQDQVPPFSGHLAEQILEKEFNQPIETLFKAFERTPIASASIAQVHAAILHSGEKVAVKILRPKIQQHIQRDIRFLKTMVRFLQRYSKKMRLFKLYDMVEEFEKTLHQEIDLLREGANASQMRRQFQGSDLFYVPIVYWDYTTHNILVTEYIDGIPLSQIERLREQAVNLDKIAESLVKVFFIQVFKHCFFHADLHPGNLFVSLEENPRLIAVDFGIMGSLSQSDQKYLAHNMLAFLNRDYRRVARLHVESGWLPPNARVDDFEGSIRAICEPMFERPEKAISLGTLLLELFQMAQKYHINIQPQLLLFQKTVLYVEGLSRQLHADINLWVLARPFLEQWLKEHAGFSTMLQRLKREVPRFVQQLIQEGF